jgi:hypothetical protein
VPWPLGPLKVLVIASPKPAQAAPAATNKSAACICFEPQHLETSGARARAAGAWINTLAIYTITGTFTSTSNLEIIFELRSAIEGWGRVQ